jgi:CrcB protein
MGTHLFVVALGSAIGGVLRYVATVALDAFLDRGWPWGTFAVNIVGSFAIGALYVLIVERAGAGDGLRLFAMVGVLGGFTTFSSFSLEALMLVEQGSAVRAAGYVVGSVLLCLAAAWAGLHLARA